MPEPKTSTENPHLILDKTTLIESEDLPNEDIDLSPQSLEKIPQLEKLYARNVLTTFSVGLVDPFLTSIAIDMNITGSQMGWLRAITNLLSTFTQPIFGYLSDTINRRNIFIALSGIFYSSIWIILLFINDVIFLLVMAGLLSLAGSLGAPAWTALLGDVIPPKVRGKILARTNWFTEFSFMISTIVGGLLFNFVLYTFSVGSYTFNLNRLLPIIIGLIVGIASSIVILTFNEKKAKQRAERISVAFQEIGLHKDKLKKGLPSEIETIKLPGPPRGVVSQDQSAYLADLGSSDQMQNNNFKVIKQQKRSVINDLRVLTQNKFFIKLTLFYSIQQFFISMIWPLYPIRQYDDIPDVGYFEVAVYQVAMSLAFVLTIRYSGVISDQIGRKPQIFLNAFFLAFMPLSYAFATRIWHIIAINAIFCIFLGLTSTTIMAYLIDITPEKTRSMYIGVFNMVSGLVLFGGSLFGGYLLDFLMGKYSILGWTYNYSQFTAVSIGFIIGFIGRLVTTFPYLFLKEARYFPYPLKQLPKLAVKSRKFLILILILIVFIGLTFGFMFLMGYLP